MVKSAKKLKRKSLNSSQWEEEAFSDEEPRKLVVAPAESDEESEPESSQNSEQELQSDAEDDDAESDAEPEATPSKRGNVKMVTPLKKKKTGIIYISTIPKHMNVTILRELLEPYGDVGRIYLQPERKDGAIKKKTAKGKRAMLRYTEGWVEFKRKRVAKAVVQHLNTKPISTKKKSVFCDILWSMKYLPRFKWIHLSERLAYERAVYKQKLRTEIAQARKEASFFQSHLDQSEAVRKKAKKEKRANKD
ncbi:AAEL007655-PA [Aedes aegypti]|uniref:Activator of basal transcription 1 n=2 Tax=Aedes aegypti TaxID=7159 RepID=Q171F6_AEDAE|nr:activator of basal transcription 1 [Aedes aegypti]EAT40635.1 AAEL007655-PA [Aedes aegypti]